MSKTKEKDDDDGESRDCDDDEDESEMITNSLPLIINRFFQSCNTLMQSDCIISS